MCVCVCFRFGRSVNTNKRSVADLGDLKNDGESNLSQADHNDDVDDGGGAGGDDHNDDC